MEELKVLVADESTKDVSSMPTLSMVSSYKALCSKCWSSPCLWKTDTTQQHQTLARRLMFGPPNASKQQRCRCCHEHYDVDSADELNQQNKPTSNALVLNGRRHSILSPWNPRYDEKIADGGSAEYAKWNHTRYRCYEGLQTHASTRCLESGVPVNVKYVGRLWRWWNRAYREEAAAFFSTRWSNKSSIHLLFISANSSKKHSVFAHESGANFNGVLVPCHGLDRWSYIKDVETAAHEWLRTTGFETIDELTAFFKQQRLHDWTCRSINKLEEPLC